MKTVATVIEALTSRRSGGAASPAKFQQKLFDSAREVRFLENVINCSEVFFPNLARSYQVIASQPFEFDMFKYSYDSLVYFGEPVDRSIARLADFGYDAIELIGEPDRYGRSVRRPGKGRRKGVFRSIHRTGDSDH